MPENKTSLETLLEAHHITRHRLMTSMGINWEDNESTLWYGKFGGKRPVSGDEIAQIKVALRKLGLPESFDVKPGKYLIV